MYSRQINDASRGNIWYPILSLFLPPPIIAAFNMFRMYDEYDDIFGSSRRRGGFSMGLDDVDRRGFAPVSQRAIGEFERVRILSFC